MPTSLLNKTCIPCKGGTPPLTTEVANKLLKELGEGWSLNAKGHLYKEYKLKNFMEAINFANKIAELAEKEGHHPDLGISWGKCTVEVWTHKIDGLTESDFILAAKIQQTFSQMQASYKDIIDRYFQFLQKAALDQLGELFTHKAVVISPLYGTIPAKEFYKTLFLDTNQSKIEIKAKFMNPGDPRICAALFNYSWTMKDGNLSKFECVDVFELSAEGKISKLKIIYDTHGTRKSFQNLKKSKKNSSK